MNKFLKIFKYGILGFRYLYFAALRRLAALVPKKKGLWLLGSWGGNRFSSSTKYLFLHLNKHPQGREAVWITGNPRVAEILRSGGLPVALKNSPRGRWLSLRAEVIFVSNEIYDVNPGFADGAVFVQCFHHVLPIKYMMRGDHKLNNQEIRLLPSLRRVRMLLNRPHALRKPDYYVTSSKWMAREVTSKMLGSEPDRILVTGFPRTDPILTPDLQSTAYLHSLVGDLDLPGGPRVIYYLPTHRDHDPQFNPFDHGLDEAGLEELLERAGAVLIIRFHPRDMQLRNQRFKASSRRIIKEPEGHQDPYSILKQAAVLITDYGSIFSDFLVLDRPIIFANFDHESYVEARGLNWDYDQITPGHKAQSWSAVITALESLLVKNEDPYREERIKLRDQVYDHLDSRNAERLVNKIAELTRI